MSQPAHATVTAAATAVRVAGPTPEQPVSEEHSATTGPVLAVVSHPVRDHAAWRPIYDGAESIRQKAGVTGAEVFRDPNDPNQLVIVHRFETLEAAQSFLSDPDLKTAMTKSGVTSPPTVIVATGHSGRNRVGFGPVLAVISHPVTDFASWRVAYAAAEPIRKKRGVTGAEVFQDPLNANNVVIIHRFKTVSNARDFIADPDLKAAMVKGGVSAPPASVVAVRI